MSLKTSHNVSARGRLLAACGIVFLFSNCSSEGLSPGISHAQIDPPADRMEISPERRARVAALAADWPAEPAYAASYNALDPSSNAAQQLRESLFDPNDPHWGLPEAEGRDLVQAYCGACHSLRLIMQQNMVHTGWEATLSRMVSDRGMLEIQPDIRQSILSYLNEYFGADS